MQHQHQQQQQQYQQHQEHARYGQYGGGGMGSDAYGGWDQWHAGQHEGGEWPADAEANPHYGQQHDERQGGEWLGNASMYDDPWPADDWPADDAHGSHDGPWLGDDNEGGEWQAGAHSHGEEVADERASGSADCRHADYRHKKRAKKKNSDAGIQRGGWMTKCQKLCNLVLNREYESAYDLALEYSAKREANADDMPDQPDDEAAPADAADGGGEVAQDEGVQDAQPRRAVLLANND